MIQGTYTKVGSSDTRGMGDALNQGMAAQRNIFKDITGGINELLETAKKSAIEDNTLKVQEYLRNNIKNAGLGAEAPEIDQIAGTFGKLIDKDAIGKTITSTREGMLEGARDEATMAAGNAFGKTEDLGAATNAFRDKLIDQGMKPFMANSEAGKWSQDNKFMAEQAANTNALAITQFGDEVLDTLKSHGGTASTEDVVNFLSKDVPTKLRNKAITSAKAMIADREKLSSEQQLEFDHQQKTVNATLTSFDQQQAIKNAAAAAKVAQFDSIQPGIKAAATKMAGESPTGIMGKIAEDAKSWLGGLFGRLDGQEVVQDLQPHVDSLINKYDVPAEQAYAIALQSYQEAKADGGQAAIGSGASIVPEKLQERVHSHLQRWIDQRAAIAEQNNIMATGVADRARLGQAGDDILLTMRKGEGFSNISMQPYDSTAAFKKSIFGTGGVPPATQPVPGKAVAKTDTATPAVSKPVTMADAVALAKANKTKAVNVDPVKAEKGKTQLKAAIPTVTPAAAPAPVEEKPGFWSSARKITNPTAKAEAAEIKPEKKGFIAALKGFDKETREAEAKKNSQKESEPSSETNRKVSALAAKIKADYKDGQRFEITVDGYQVKGVKKNGKLIFDK